MPAYCVPGRLGNSAVHNRGVANIATATPRSRRQCISSTPAEPSRSCSGEETTPIAEKGEQHNASAEGNLSYSGQHELRLREQKWREWFDFPVSPRQHVLLVIPVAAFALGVHAR
jgi:hypothetical protein